MSRIHGLNNQPALGLAFLMPLFVRRREIERIFCRRRGIAWAKEKGGQKIKGHPPERMTLN